MLSKIRGFHDGDYEEWRFLGCYAVSLVRTDVSEEATVSIIRMEEMSELETLAVVKNLSTLRRKAVSWLVT
jgi:hypothetical protein